MSDEIIGRIHSLESFGAVDGPGVRFVVFLQGCGLRCLYCHNPDSWDSCGGNEISSKELTRRIKSCKSFISSGGVTLSGGEPLLQSAFCEAVIRECKRMGLHTAIDTSGDVDLAVSRGAIGLADLILLDIKAAEPGLFRELTGSDIRNALATLEFCEQIAKPVWVRHVLIPDYTLDEQKLAALAGLLQPYKCVERVELLPFHKMGEYKWRSLTRDYALGHVAEPDTDDVSRAREIFERAGLPLSPK